MQIELDGQKVDVQGEKLGEILDEVSQNHISQGHMVVDVNLNGESVSGDSLVSMRETQVLAGTLVLQSADLKNEVLSVLIEMISQLPEAQVAFQAAADAIQADKTAETTKSLTEAFKIWQNVHLALVSSQELFKNQIDMPGLEGNVKQLEQHLITLRDALKSGDLLGLADSLEYEWPEITDNWCQQLETLVATLSKDSQND